MSSDVRYVTLGHCWGSGVVLKLTQSSLQQFTAEIPISQLSSTFRHAVNVTKRLGVRYIWIDSLCIIQDSVQDWHQESVRMWEVYLNSYCTIAATASTDGRGGLYRTRDPRVTSFCRIDCNWDGLEPGTYDCSLENEWNTKIIQAPLNQRGWVYQERLLSTRIIHFAEDQVFWNCGKVLASETFPEGLPMRIGGETRTRGTDWSWLSLEKVPWTTLREQCFQMWHACVADYSNASLTQPGDKLSAIAGLARLIHHHFDEDCTYLAGLWSLGLEWQLMWEIMNPIKPHTRTETYRAPSWSWASIDGPVGIETPIGSEEMAKGYSLTIKITQAATSPIASPFGSVTGGALFVRARLFEVRLQLGDPDESTDFLCRITCRVKLTGHEHPAEGQADVSFDEDLKSASELENKRIFCMPVKSFDSEEECCVAGLVLVPIGSDCNGEFQRYGYFEKWNDRMLHGLFVKDPLRRNAHKELKDLDKDGFYDITIV